MKSTKQIRGLYAITPDEPNTPALLRDTGLALRGGARVIQYRNKSADAALRLLQAAALRKLTRQFAATFIVNDDAQLAARVDADGVHLGAEDGGVERARQVLGGNKLIGISCYNRLPLAHDAAAAGADYVAFGAFFCSGIKPDAVRAELALLRQARAELQLPLVAIGGVTPANARVLLEAGADALAVISAVFNEADIQTAAVQFSQLFVQESKL
ncbi:MAG: thiamine phosphate synthase [Pseudomonadota bacterium]